MNFRVIFFSIIICFFTIKGVNAQGCSDAGFCSINGVNPSSHLDSSKTLKNQLQIGITSGLAQFGVFISSPYLQYDVQASEELILSAKINYTLTNGSLTSNNGFSDVFLSINYNIYKINTSPPS